MPGCPSIQIPKRLPLVARGVMELRTKVKPECLTTARDPALALDGRTVSTARGYTLTEYLRNVFRNH